MTDYNGQTVVQLRELLKSRGLMPQGLKNELVERLLEDDSKKAQVNTDEKKEVEQDKRETVKNEKQEEKQDENEDENEKQDEKGEKKQESEPPADPKSETENKEKDYKEMAIELLKKKLHRAKKFGQDQEQIDSLQKMLIRIEKFGLDPNMPIAQEVGMGESTAFGRRTRQRGKRNKEKSKKLSRKSHRRK